MYKRQVLDSINSSYTESNANVHRALYALGAKATEKYEGAREKISAFIGANSHKEIIFTSGATESLNLLAYSLGNDINPGDEILISEMEHHSILFLGNNWRKEQVPKFNIFLLQKMEN